MLPSDTAETFNYVAMKSSLWVALNSVLYLKHQVKLVKAEVYLFSFDFYLLAQLFKKQ